MDKEYQIKVQISAPELVGALKDLIQLIGVGLVPPVITVAQPQVAPSPAPAPAPTIPVAVVPTVTTCFTLDQIVQAAAALADASDDSREKVLELLRLYNVPALSDLPVDQYGNFATQLRGLGAKI